MQYPINELADKYSILKLKKERLPESNLDADIKRCEEELKNYTDINDFINRLYDINSKIWEHEYGIRIGVEKNLGYEAIGKAAVQVREHNKIRVAIKNEISDYYKTGFKDIKINHGSE